LSLPQANFAHNFNMLLHFQGLKDFLEVRLLPYFHPGARPAFAGCKKRVAGEFETLAFGGEEGV
jgi:hypothetical protein